MLVRCTPEQKGLIMSNVIHLKEKCNSTGNIYFIVNLIPEALKEQQRQTNELTKEVKQKDDATLPNKKKSTVHQCVYIYIYICVCVYVYPHWCTLIPLISTPYPQDLFRGPKEN